MCNLRCLTTLVALICALAALAARPAPAADDTEAALIDVLQSNAPAAEKAITCKRLVTVGTKECVPALAALLPDKELSSWARIPLEAIPDAAAGAALRQALGTLEGRLLVGVINSLGVRRDADAVDALASRLVDADLEVASAAAVALGRIGNAAATAVLQPALTTAPDAVRGAVAEACVYCAEQRLAAGDRAAAVSLYDQVRAAPVPKPRILEATRGAIVARDSAGVPLLVEQLESADRALFSIGLSTARELAGPEVTAALVGELSKVAPERQALLLQALADRGDKSSLPAVLEAARSGPEAVRVAAIDVVPALGDAACIPALLDLAAAAEPAVAQAAGRALQTLPGEAIDAELTGRLAQAQGSARRALIEAVGQRRIEAAVPALLQAVHDSDTQIRAAALTALGATVTAEELPVLIQFVVSAAEDEGARKALLTACIRMPDREACAEQLIGAMTKAPPAAQVAFIEVLGAMGGARALGALSAAAKEGHDALKDAATQQLGKWMTVDAAPVLLEIARVAREEKYRSRAVRAYLRIAKQIETRPEARVELCQKILPLCRRDDEKTLLVTALEPKPTAAGLKLVASLLPQASVRDEAGRAAVAMAQEVIKSDKAAVAEAMQQVVAAGGKPELVNRAKELAAQAQR